MKKKWPGKEDKKVVFFFFISGWAAKKERDFQIGATDLGIQFGRREKKKKSKHDDRWSQSD